MKLHIFVATTQGVVAIQNIHDLNDADINSLVSINGTSTISAISGGYHNFVKKGSGIIQREFGGISYRVNISEQIDQGNSWQLAFYLAHAAHQQGILGNGVVQSGDSVIVATGEVNTSERRVLPVEQVPKKLSLLSSKLEQWAQLTEKVHILIPSKNMADVDESFVSKVQSVDLLDDALKFLPSLAASRSEKSEIEIKDNEAVTPSKNRGSWMLACTLLAAGLMYGGYHYLSSQAIPTQQNADLPQTEQVDDEIGAEQNTAPDEVQNDKDEIKPEVEVLPETSVEPLYIAMSAELKKNNRCETTEKIDLEVQNQSFKPVLLNQLCGLNLTGSNGVKTILLVAQDTKAVRILSSTENGWSIPLPKSRLTDRSYYLFALSSKLSDSQARSLASALEDVPAIRVTKETKRWFKSLDISSSVFSHKLLNY